MRSLLAIVFLYVLSASGDPGEGMTTPTGARSLRLLLRSLYAGLLRHHGSAAPLASPVGVVIPSPGSPYVYALRPRVFHFPSDHASHPEYRVEWWYYTGNLAAGTRPFGYQLTLFRVGVDPAWRRSRSAWAAHDVLFAHLALTDPARRRFLFHERIERPALGMAGADTVRERVWIDDWSAALAKDGRTHELRARAADMAFALALAPEKPPVIHGKDGLSRKSAAYGNASHYYSLTCLSTAGWIRTGRESLAVRGTSWMDHEFSTSQLDSSQVGWDWFSIQLDSNQELMLYQLRHRDGSLPRSAFAIESTGRWKSPHSGAIYPHGWRVRVPSRDADLIVTPVLDDQELRGGASGGVVYWEGSVRVSGIARGAPVHGAGYVELTGYAGAPPGLNGSAR
ncbi:MAG: carotenoid 1,2-hydratase [Candidatus Eisenbacteria bacterium]|uniref:Carotenoid 1,2-hydratase n=1 Tax=Eiseniibacteriota bacterium TaxID=2212470 RepID=A0A538U674_UNCEI|nr:MAG: carotenoid 1,2-hydratase [Candidatus Eisenbacteria bacterium]